MKTMLKVAAVLALCVAANTFGADSNVTVAPRVNMNGNTPAQTQIRQTAVSATARAAAASNANITVTSGQRGNSAAHRERGAIDIVPSSGNLQTIARATSREVPAGRVIVEQVNRTATTCTQTNTTYVNGTQGRTRSGPCMSSDQLHATGTHIHVQPH